MTILSPEQFLEQNDPLMFKPGYPAEKSVRMKSELARHGRLPETFVLPATCKYIESLTNVYLTPDQLQEMLALYPAEKSKIARFTASDFAHCDLAKTGTGVKESYLLADMVAHFFGRTLWPRAADAVDRKAFLAKIQRSAMFLGYSVGGCTLEKLSA